MRKEYDFSKATRGAVIPAPGKSRITIMLDDDVLQYFRERAERDGVGYQTMMNAALRLTSTNAASKEQEPLTVAKLREVLRQELYAA